MDQKTVVFEVERDTEPLILAPVTNLGELALQSVESEANAILELLVNSSLRHVVVNFRRTD